MPIAIGQSIQAAICGSITCNGWLIIHFLFTIQDICALAGKGTRGTMSVNGACHGSIKAPCSIKVVDNYFICDPFGGAMMMVRG